jgi:hypothetical protein
MMVMIMLQLQHYTAHIIVNKQENRRSSVFFTVFTFLLFFNSANEKAVLFVVLGNKNNDNSCWGLKSWPEIKTQPGKVALVFLVKNRAACFFLSFLRLYRSVFFFNVFVFLYVDHRASS